MSIFSTGVDAPLHQTWLIRHNNVSEKIAVKLKTPLMFQSDGSQTMVRVIGCT